MGKYILAWAPMVLLAIVNALGCGCEIRRSNGGLVLSHRRYPDKSLQSIDTDRFFCSWGFIGFERDAAGTLSGFSLSDELFGLQGIRFARIPNGRASPVSQ